MRLNFVKLDPNGNITLLATSPVPRAQQPGIAARLMRGDVSDVRVENSYAGDILRDVEQVGFVEPASLPGARARLQMMGGEFCGNASMSLAALVAREDGLRAGEEAEIVLEVSGADGLVRCRVDRIDANNFLGSASMPLPEAFDEVSLPGELRAPLVRFPGIAHLILPEGSLSAAEAEALVPKLCAGLNADALGLLFVNSELTSMRPLVYVRSTGSAVWENGCGSGTAALGAYAALREGQDAELTVAQPGGSIGVRARCQSVQITSIEIQGTVRIASEGALEL